MKIPAFLFGTYQDVHKATRKAVKDFWRGATFAEAFESGAFLNTADMADDEDWSIATIARRTNAYSPPCFYLHFLPNDFAELQPQSNDYFEQRKTEGARLFAGLIGTPWGIALLSNSNINALSPLAESFSFLVALQAAAYHWKVIEGVGQRYNNGGTIILSESGKETTFRWLHQNTPFIRLIQHAGPVARQSTVWVNDGVQKSTGTAYYKEIVSAIKLLQQDTDKRFVIENFKEVLKPADYSFIPHLSPETLTWLNLPEQVKS